MGENDLVIKLTQLCFGYTGAGLILDNVNLDVQKGDRVGLVGPNGSGKTTLFQVIMGLLKPSSGEIEIFGKSIRNESDFKDVRQKIGLLFQDADDQLFSPTVLEDVAFGPLNLGKSQEQARQISMKTLEILGLLGFENRITHKLSGGEKKLVSLATVLAMEPQILLLDEPTTGLDEKTKTHFIDVLRELDLSYILISHEIDFLSETTNCVYAMEDGKVVSDSEACLHPHYHRHIHGRYPHDHE